MKMKKLILLFCLGALLLFSCVSKKRIVVYRPDSGFSAPMTFPTDSFIYFCAQHTVAYRYREDSSLQDYIYIERDVCNCFSTPISLLEENIIRHSEVDYFEGANANTIIIWDRSFISEYILPECSRVEHKKEIEYTLAHSDDSTFTAENIIDYYNKVIINDKMYYYPLKTKRAASVIVYNLAKFYSILPKSSWIFYGEDCFDDGQSMYVRLLIPLLDKNDKTSAKKRR